MFVKCCMLGTVLFCVSTLTCNAWRPYDVKLTNLTFQSSNNLLFANITLKDSVIDAWIDLRETVRQLYVHVEVYLDLGNGKYEFEFMNRTIDVCRFFRDRKYEPFVQVIYKRTLLYCNCPNRCPIAKKLYYLKGSRFSTEYFPPVFPERKAFTHVKYLKKIDGNLELLGLSVVESLEKIFKSNGNI